MAVTLCPECGHDLGADLYEGQRVICTTCKAHLEVINLESLELDWVYDKLHHPPEDDWQIEIDWERRLRADE